MINPKIIRKVEHRSSTICLAAVLLASVAGVTACRHLLLSAIPGAKDFISAAACIGRLYQSGDLPGIKKGERLEFQTLPARKDRLGNSSTNRLQAITIWATVKGKKDTVFWYYLTRTNRNSEWSLAKAWRADWEGRNAVNLLEGSASTPMK